MIYLNNPGKILASREKWDGKVIPLINSRYEAFNSVENGICALALMLLGYGKTTLGEIITQYALDSEQPLPPFLEYVCGDLLLEPAQKLDLSCEIILGALIKSIIEFVQNDPNAVTMAQINKGISLC